MLLAHYSGLDWLSIGNTAGCASVALMSVPTATTATLEPVRAALESYSDNPSAFLALNQGNSYFTKPGVPGVVVYRPCGHRLVQFGGPFAPDNSYRELLECFTAFARADGMNVVAIQLQQRDAVRYAEAGYAVNQVGASYAVDLSEFSLRGSRFVRLRNKISRSFRSGLTVTEVAQPDWHDAMLELDSRWLRSKGKHAKPLEFLVGEYGGEM
jgi:lysylphosphatidylglycerol synthetase-like protein (DUF2156 family)